jgi:hypothetical protein
MKDNDVGKWLMRRVRAALQVADEWVVSEERGFTWWPHRLAQHVRYQPVVHTIKVGAETFSGLLLVRVETDVWRGVEPESHLALPLFNRLASLNSFVYDPLRERVTLRCSAYVDLLNAGLMARFFGAAAMLQAAEAQRLREVVENGEDEAQLTFDDSPHPQRGWRKQPDEILGAAAAMGAVGSGDSSFTADDLAQALKMPERPWTMAQSGERQLVAEFPFETGTSAGLFARTQAAPLRTALFQAFNDQSHPALGSGLLTLLRLPLILQPERAAELANELNLAESQGKSDGAFFGSWTLESNSRSLTYTSFIPRLLRVDGLVELLLLNAARRTAWAQDFLSNQAGR